MGEAGRRRVIRNFSWPESARQIVEIYRELTGRTGPGPMAR
jgi:glycosyltransferase involved in cell wall biosynthesis